jgi:hypothetical protein
MTSSLAFLERREPIPERLPPGNARETRSSPDRAGRWARESPRALGRRQQRQGQRSQISWSSRLLYEPSRAAIARRWAQCSGAMEGAQAGRTEPHPQVTQEGHRGPRLACAVAEGSLFHSSLAVAGRRNRSPSDHFIDVTLDCRCYRETEHTRVRAYGMCRDSRSSGESERAVSRHRSRPRARTS